MFPHELPVEDLILDTAPCSEVRLWGAIDQESADFNDGSIDPTNGFIL